MTIVGLRLYIHPAAILMSTTLVELTFILLARPDTEDSSSSRGAIPSANEIKSYKMIGDVNLFLPSGVEEDVECEIMIAGEFLIDTRPPVS